MTQFYVQRIEIFSSAEMETRRGAIDAGKAHLVELDLEIRHAEHNIKKQFPVSLIQAAMFLSE